MLLSPSLGLIRCNQRSDATAIRLAVLWIAVTSRAVVTPWAGIALLIFATVAPMLVGCATLGWHRADSKQIAAGRELSRQGVAAMESGQWQEAEDFLKQAVEASPEDAAARRYLAETLWHRDAKREAMLHMADAVRLDPTDETLAVRAGEMALAVGAYEDALDRSEHAIRLDPKLAAAWSLRGRTFSRLNQPDRAIADLQHALELSPQSYDVMFDLALIYRQQGHAARALAILHSLLDSYAPGEEPQFALMLEGQTLIALGRPHQAVDSLSAASRQGPPNAEIWFLLAQAQSSVGQHAAATAAVEQALEIDTSHAASRQLLAQLAASSPRGNPPRK